MGQYYIPIIITNNGCAKTFSPHDYNNSYKLMGHSYIGNDFVNMIAAHIWKTPAKIAWIGDYSDEYQGDVYEKKMSHDEFMRYHDAAWPINDPELKEEAEKRRKPIPSKRVYSSKMKHEMNCDGAFLVNHTTKEVLDLDDYRLVNAWQEEGGWRDGKYEESLTTTWCVNPLPLLTACGNGRGGGDYDDRLPCCDKVGIWAFDVLELTDKKPDYNNVMFEFTEQQNKILG